MVDEPKLVALDGGPALALAGGEPPGPPGARRSHLVMVRGHALGRRYAIETHKTTVGRDSESDIVVDDALVAQHHVALTRDESGVRLRDLGSTGGTFVNDERVDQTRLAHGDLLSLGRSAFKVLDTDEPDQAYHEELAALSKTDPMTRLTNKRYFEHVLERAQRHALPLAVWMLDLDHLARCNEAHGQHAGDDVLRQVAALAMAHAREVDIVGRWAGQTFAAILPGLGRDQAAAQAEALREAIAGQSCDVDGVQVAVTASLGVTALDDETTTVAELVARAQARVATAKRRGRNVVDAGA